MIDGQDVSSIIAFDDYGSDCGMMFIKAGTEEFYMYPRVFLQMVNEFYFRLEKSSYGTTYHIVEAIAKGVYHEKTQI